MLILEELQSNGLDLKVKEVEQNVILINIYLRNIREDNQKKIEYTVKQIVLEIRLMHLKNIYNHLEKELFHFN